MVERILALRAMFTRPGDLEYETLCEECRAKPKPTTICAKRGRGVHPPPQRRQVLLGPVPELCAHRAGIVLGSNRRGEKHPACNPARDRKVRTGKEPGCSSSFYKPRVLGCARWSTSVQGCARGRLSLHLQALPGAAPSAPGFSIEIKQRLEQRPATPGRALVRGRSSPEEEWAHRKPFAPGRPSLRLGQGGRQMRHGLCVIPQVHYCVFVPSVHRRRVKGSGSMAIGPRAKGSRPKGSRGKEAIAFRRPGRGSPPGTSRRNHRTQGAPIMSNRKGLRSKRSGLKLRPVPLGGPDQVPRDRHASAAAW